MIGRLANNKLLRFPLVSLIILLISGSSSNVATVEAAFSGHGSSGYQSSTLTQSVDTSSSLLPESPRCWKMAVALFHQTQLTAEQGEQLIAKLCQIMPEEKLKLLALEIARCHLEDLGKPLMEDPSLVNQCSMQPEGIMPDVHYCLKHLTDAGANAYTHYVSYVQQLCTRLTQEIIMNIQHEATDEMAKRHAEISRQSIELTERQMEQMAMLANMPEQVKERLTEELTESLKLTLSESLDHQITTQLPAQLHQHLDHHLRDLLSSHATEQAKVAEMILKQAEQQSEAQKERIEHLYENQRRLLDAQLHEQREKVKALSDTLSKTTQTIQPLLGIQTLVVAATQGYTWLTFLLHFLGTFNIIWLFTRPKRCHYFRGYLFSVVLMEALFEIGVMMLQQHDLITESERMVAVVEVRRWTLGVECLVYILGFVFAGSSSPNQHHGQASDEEELLNHQDSTWDICGPPTKHHPPNYPQSHASLYGQYQSTTSPHMYLHSFHADASARPPRGAKPLEAHGGDRWTSSSQLTRSSGRDHESGLSYPSLNVNRLGYHNNPMSDVGRLHSVASVYSATTVPSACRATSLVVGSVEPLARGSLNEAIIPLAPHSARPSLTTGLDASAASNPSGDDEALGSIQESASMDGYFSAEEYNESHKRPMSDTANSDHEEGSRSKRARRHEDAAMDDDEEEEEEIMDDDDGSMSD